MQEVRNLVIEFLNIDKSGHGDDHALRVYELALKFAKELDANEEIVGVCALLHVKYLDDYLNCL